MEPILSLEHVGKSYRSGTRELTVLQGVSFVVAPGATFSIIGPSGSGKTTLLGLCAGLDQVGSGVVRLNGIDLGPLSEDERAAVRAKHVGFVFQNFQLLPTLTALENVMVPIELLGQSGARATARELLRRVGLGDRLDHYPAQLSGGEQQRVSIARAFANNPKILFADEPTGNLDEAIGQQVESLLFELNRERGTTLIIVTHDNDLAARTERTVRLKGGRLVSDTHNASSSR